MATTERADLRESADVDATLRAMTLPATLGEFIAERAATLGDKKAVHWFEDDQSLTYAELDRAANRLASSLLPLGVRKGAHVAVMLRSCCGHATQCAGNIDRVDRHWADRRSDGAGQYPLYTHRARLFVE